MQARLGWMVGAVGGFLACQACWADQLSASGAISDAVSQAAIARACDPSAPNACGGDAFCSRPPGTCGQPNVKGVCLPIPTRCPDEVKPVCGCDGNTYRNRCLAARARVSIAHQGACVRRCDANHPCNDNEFCNFPLGTCGAADAVGVCAPLPNDCGNTSEPVCGCDGNTYINRCKAAAAGISIAHRGRCPDRCNDQHPCPSGSYCEFPPGTCRDTNRHGLCRPQPTECSDADQPVCGCDGQTYANPCWAAKAGVSIAQRGPCPRPCRRGGDPLCNEGEYCHFPPGTCDENARGQCRPVPDACPEVYAPVCSCDGVTYDNECFAAMAGATVAYRGPCGRRCSRTSPCMDGEFCQFPLGTCNDPAALGICSPRPSGCPDVWEPVCGCDGVTYSNRCDAAAAGISIAHPGPCRRECNPWSLGPVAQCMEDEFCRLPPGACRNQDSLGVCAPRPDTCPLEPTVAAQCRPVCGCDGQTYCTECEAAMAGVNIAYFGECRIPCDPADPSGSPCSDTQFCQLPPGTCYAADAKGSCTYVPTGCPDNWEPVCGCDGNTYSNACEAAAHRVSIRHHGECRQRCGGFAGLPCDEGEFCKLPPGQCNVSDLEGICRPVPGGCPTVYDPVCGCDGRTYPNECEADKAGVQIRHRGPCGESCHPADDNSGRGCPDGHFCQLPPGSCGGVNVPGRCTPIPNGCPDVYDPVCGCDGQTYGNRCEAWRAGVSIDYPGECRTRCDSAHPCDDDRFCMFPPGTCGAPGTVGECIPRPETCPEIYQPVCGCDGQTYQNRCVAAQAGVSIRAQGPCDRRCGGIQGLDCPENDDFCKYPPGTCGNGDIFGVCTDRPGACDRINDPVCGCDGRTYPNECEADRAGVSIKHRGVCERRCARRNSAGLLPCGAGEFCLFPPGTCDDASAVGVCTPRPNACDANDTVPEPVCGCDGNTYRSRCAAAAAGVSISHVGPCDNVCGGIAGWPCDSGEYCKLPPGMCDTADLTGVCLPIPRACPAIYMPVCGCDGKTYANECEAAVAGAQIRHRGPCPE